MNFDSQPLFEHHSYYEYEPAQLIDCPLIFDEELQVQPDFFGQMSNLQIQKPLIPQFMPHKRPVFASKDKDNNPNLLKNIITIIKTWVKIREYPSPEIQAIWKLFISSKKINHLLIKTVFGVAKETSQDVLKILNSNTQLLSSSRNALNNSAIIQAHKYIRDQTVKQIQEADISYIIKNRRVKNSQGFQKHFRAFIGALKEGGVPKSFKVSRLVETEKEQFRTSDSYRE